MLAPRAGGVFSVSLWVVDATKTASSSERRVISSGDIRLQWHNTALEVINVVPGNAFGANPLVIQNVIDSTAGAGLTHLVVARQSGNSTAGGDPAPQTLAIIKLRVRSGAAPADYLVGILETKLADANGQDIGLALGPTGEFSIITVGKQEMGDLNGDGVVDYRDLGIFAGVYGTSSEQTTFNEKADLNGDGLINYVDLAIFGANYGK